MFMDEACRLDSKKKAAWNAGAYVRDEEEEWQMTSLYER